MPDISKCSNEGCIMKKLCFRFTAPSVEFSQSSTKFKPKGNTEIYFECDYFTPNRPKKY
jgi:hypothetical protein